MHSYRNGLITGILVSAVASAIAGSVWRAWRPSAIIETKPSPPPPATMATVVKEEQFNTIALTAEAEARLNLQTAAIERRSMPRTRVYGGEVVVPAGHTILVAAPLGGILKTPPEGMPLAGHRVKRGQVICQLLPLLTPEGRANLAAARIDADGQVKTATAQHDAARIALDRAKRLLANDAGSRRMVDEAEAQFEVAQKTLAAATARRDLLTRVVGEFDQGTAAPLDIESPQDGLLRGVTALPGQSVPAGGALFEVIDVQRVWIRVPVYVGDMPEIDEAGTAAIGDLAVVATRPPRAGKPIPAPPSANAAAGTVDLYYDVDNGDGRYRPGERVGANLPLQGETQSLVVPWSAVVYDIYGGAWVYEQTGERVYARRRVSVRSVTGDLAVLAAGPNVGTRVVVAGAAELFGAETGFTK